MTKREQSAVGFDPENKRFCERNKAVTGESMSDLINRLLKEYREAHEEIKTDKDGVIIARTAEDAKVKMLADDHAIRQYLRENDHLLYMGKVHRKTGKSDILKIKDELFFSKYKVDTTAELIKPILRDEIEKFDTLAYEKKKNIKRVIK